MRRVIRNATLLSWSCLVGAGCPPDEPSPDAGPAGGDLCSTTEGYELQVGTAPESGEGFVPFEDGDDVPLVWGAQGGYHIYLSYLVRGYDPNGIVVRKRVSFAVNGDEITENPEALNLRPPDEPADDTYCGLRNAQLAILCPTIVGQIEDADLVIEVDLEDLAGEATSVTRYARAVCPTDEEPDEDGRTDCNRICDGPLVE